MPKNKDQPVDRVVAEETTTLPEGAVISVYRIRVGKLGHQSTRLVAIHGNLKRVEMGMDNMPAHNLRQYLQLVMRDIARRRAELTSKPLLDPLAGGKPNDMKQFVLSMAFNDMFIFEALTVEPEKEPDADNHTATKKVLPRSRKAKGLPQVLPDNNGTVSGSGKAKADRGRTKQ